jgi:hypothetical protein
MINFIVDDWRIEMQSMPTKMRGSQLHVNLQRLF